MSDLDPSTIVDQLPYEFVARLEANPYFVDIPVVPAEEGNVKLQLSRKQAVTTTKSQGKWGAAVIVLQIVEEDFRPNLQFGPMMLHPAFQVIENVDQNKSASGTGKSYRQIARQIVLEFKGTILEGFIKQIEVGKPGIEPIHLASDLGDGVRGCQVNLKCLESSTLPMSRVQTPVLTPFAGPGPQVQIACATPGAVIYFTTDGSYPQPAGVNPKSTAQVYGGPVNIPAGGFVVRACAYVDGMVASSVPRKTISVDGSS